MTAYDTWKTDAPEPLDLAVLEGAISTVTADYNKRADMEELLTVLYYSWPSVHEAMFQLRLPEPLNRDFAELERTLRSLKSQVDDEVVKQSAYQEKDDE